AMTRSGMNNLRQDIYARTRPLNRRLQPTRFAPAAAMTYEQFRLGGNGGTGFIQDLNGAGNGNGDGDEVVQYFWNSGVYTPVTSILIQHDTPEHPTNRFPPYIPPPSPPPGFTRNVYEDQVIVCPNCDHELGKEGSVPEQTQIWAVKQCGHVYCGLCAHNRKSRSRQSNHKTRPFSRCVVEGCGKSVSSPSAMIQIYL
ncbi:hypothetical protein KEM54_001923, partial [Ascosphaera aggregata]